MRRRSKVGGKPAKARRRKTATPKRRKAPKAVRSRSPGAESQETDIARLTRELREAQEQQTATSEVLGVISSSPGDLNPVFNAVLVNATRICEASFGALFRLEDGVPKHAAQLDLPRNFLAFLTEHRPKPGPHNPLCRVVNQRQTAHIGDYRQDQAYLERDPMAVAGVDIAGIRTLLIVPMLKDDMLVGLMAIFRQEVRPFTDRQVALLQNFAAQAVIAIENTRLLSELRESLQQQTATADVLKVISSSPGELEPVFDAMLENATSICDAKFGNIYRWDGDSLHLVATHNTPPAFAASRRSSPFCPGPETPTGRMVATKTVTHVADLAAERAYSERDPVFVEGVEVGGIRTLLSVPMLKENALIGAFTIYRQEVRPFTNKQIELVQNFAAQAVIAIENTRLLSELRESLEQQTATSEVLSVISSSPGELEPVFQAMLENATRICEAKVGNLFLREGNNFRAVAVHGESDYAEGFRRDPLALITENPGSPLDRIARTKRVIHIADLREDQSYRDGNPRIVSLVETAGARSHIVIPMLKESDLIGAIVIYRQEVRPFSDKQIKLLTNFAAQAVIAIENTRLLSELRESLQQQTATADVLKVISRSTFDLQTVLDTLVESAARLCEADKASINRAQPDDSYRAIAMHGFSPEFVKFAADYTIPAGMGSTVGRTVMQGTAIQIPDVRADTDYRMPDMVGFGEIRTILGVPMLREGKPIGVIALMRSQVRPFTERQIELAQTFADQAVIAIENVRLFDSVEARTRELTAALEQQAATSEVLNVISRSKFDLQPILQSVVDTAARLCRADTAVIFRLEKDIYRFATGYCLDPRYMDIERATPITPGPGTVVGRAVMRREVVRIVDAMDDPLYEKKGDAEIAQVRSMIGVPLMREGEPIGVIALARQRVEPFAEREIELVSTFADQAAIAIENVRLFESVEARTRELAKSLEDLRTAQDRLVQTEKLASLGQLTAGIAHEIKNPLNFVNNFSAVSVELIDELREVLGNAHLDARSGKEVGEIADMLQGNLDKVVQHGKRADSIVKNMLLHSREGSGEHRPVDINALVEESLNLAYHGARAEKQGFNIVLEKSFDPAAGEVDLFPQEITRVLLNLISNGFYAATKRNAEANGGDREPTLTTATKNLGDSVEIRIHDNGTGIPPEVKEKMFNPFFTTKPAGEGTGLGLSISHDIIVKQHAGSISVATEPGRFTEFRIVLPRAGAATVKTGERA
jgi:GAF domain-containing protein